MEIFGLHPLVALSAVATVVSSCTAVIVALSDRPRLVKATFWLAAGLIALVLPISFSLTVLFGINILGEENFANLFGRAQIKRLLG